MQFLTVLLNIVIFVLCLSLVVCIHEAGHLMMAKLFNVYCFEYSIGFGPKIFRKKFTHRKKKKPLYEANEPEKAELTTPKVEEEQTIVQESRSQVLEENKSLLDRLNSLDERDKLEEEKEEKKKEKKHRHSDKYDYYEGETYFAIRALPLGGYVSMAGEDGEENDEGIKVPPERTLPGVNHLKQIAIMLAGIMMNFLLAYILFYVDFAFCPQQKSVTETNAVTVSETVNNEESAAYSTGLRTGDKIVTMYQTYDNLYDDNYSENGKMYSSDEASDYLTFPTTENRTTLTSYLSYTGSTQTADYYAHESIAYAVQDVISHNRSEGLEDIPGFENMQAGEKSTRTFHITYEKADGGEVVSATATVGTTLSNNVYTFDAFGISVTVETFYYDKLEAFSIAGRQFGYLFVNIYNALGGLFTPSGWQNMGGIISVYRVSAAGVASQSVGYFILLWGYISLNLGCFNLLPFPGLDGWQTLIAIIEGVSRKKIPTKAKGIANGIGLLVLMGLAVLLIIKDLVV